MNSIDNRVAHTDQHLDRNISPYFWPLLNLLDKVPLSPVVTYAIISICSYVIYLSLAFATGVLVEAVTSFMHLQQISFSIAIFLGLFLGRQTSLSFDRVFAESRAYFCIDSDTYYRMVKKTRDIAGKWYSILLALPLMILSSITCFGVGLDIPNKLFPVSMRSPLFIYFGFLEFSVFCLYLLGALGFWFLFVMTSLFRKFEQLDLQISALRVSSQLYELPSVVLRSVVYIFLIMNVVLPPLVYIVLQYKQYKIVLWIGSIGLASAYLILLTLAVSVKFSVHRMMVKAKYRRLDNISDTFERIQNRIESFPNGFQEGEAGFRELDELIRLNEYLQGVYKETDEVIPEWAFDLRSIGELIISGFIPIVSLISMIIPLFQP